MKLIGLDVGTKRIGIAKADTSVKIAIPYGMVGVDGTEFEKISKLSNIYGATTFVIGLPRNSKGEETAQSRYVRVFAKNLKIFLPAAIIKFQDESLTSVQARENLKFKKGGINKKRGDVDTEAAVLILQDFLESLALKTPKTPSASVSIPVSSPLHPRPVASKPQAPIAKAPTPKPLKPFAPTNDPLAVAKTARQNSPAAKIATPVSPLKKAPVAPPKNPTALPAYSNLTGTKKGENRPLNGKPYKKGYKKWILIRVLIIFLFFVGVASLILKIWYDNALKPVASLDCSVLENTESDACKIVEFTVKDGDSVATIADNLEKQGLIKSALAFKIYLKLSQSASSLKSGVYNFKKTSSLTELADALINGTTNAIVFRMTILPGETLKNIRKQLISIGYDATEVDTALEKTYSHPILADKPKDKSLEGYLFGETYEFYQSDPVEKIITTMLDQLTTVASKNDLKNKFAENGLSLYEGIVLASIIQKEAGNLSLEDQKNVAGVFYNRLKAGIALGSDVTVTYALDQLSEEERAEYSDNAEKLTIDSCYNTRLHAGLPCGPISNPGAFALIAAANPADTSYLYFLTGDDGVMYYSDTDAGHLQNVRDHCQQLCDVSL